MARWEPGTRQRLQQAALELMTEHGFDGTTVADIASAAGTTERTFFRYFADKREVLFYGQEQFEQAFLDGLEAATDDSPPALVEAVLHSAAQLFPEERRPWSRARQVAIGSHPALLERELLKMSGLAGSLTSALTERGLDPTIAALSAESIVSVFRTSFAQWIVDGETRTFADLLASTRAQLRGVVT